MMEIFKAEIDVQLFDVKLKNVSTIFKDDVLSIVHEHWIVEDKYILAMYENSPLVFVEMVIYKVTMGKSVMIEILLQAMDVILIVDWKIESDYRIHRIQV